MSEKELGGTALTVGDSVSCAKGQGPRPHGVGGRANWLVNSGAAVAPFQLERLLRRGEVVEKEVCVQQEKELDV